MREDLSLADRHTGTTESAARRDRNRNYHRDRAAAERKVAAATEDSGARGLHMQLAELHEVAMRQADKE